MSLRRAVSLVVASAMAAPVCDAQAPPTGHEPARFGRFVRQIEGGLRDPVSIDFHDDAVLMIHDRDTRRIPFDITTGEQSKHSAMRSPPLAPLTAPLPGGGLVTIPLGENEVRLTDAQGRLTRTFGTWGNEQHNLVAPQGLATSPHGDIFIADTGNDRIVRFDANGDFINAWGGHGGFPGLLNRPMGLAFHEGLLYVADSANHRIQVFTPDGDYVYEWGLHVIRPHEGEGRIHYPSDIEFSPNGELVAVLEPIERRAQVFTLIGPNDDQPTSSAFFERADAPHFGDHIAIAGQLMVTTEPDTGQVVVWTLAREQPIVITRIGKRGPGIGQFREPGDVAIDYERRRVWVADPWSRRVSVFQLDWEPSDPPGYDPFMAKLVKTYDLNTMPVERWGWERGVEPIALALLPDGGAVVIDRASASTVHIDAHGSLDNGWGTWERAGLTRDVPELGRPVDLAVDLVGSRLLVLDADAHALGAPGILPVAFDGAPAFEARPLTDIGSASSVAVTDELIAVSGTDRDQIATLKRSAVAPASTFGSAGLGPAQFYRPSGIAVAEDGRLYIVDRGNHRIQVLEPDGTFVTAFGARLYVQPAINPDAAAP